MARSHCRNEAVPIRYLCCIKQLSSNSTSNESSPPDCPLFQALYVLGPGNCETIEIVLPATLWSVRPFKQCCLACSSVLEVENVEATFVPRDCSDSRIVKFVESEILMIPLLRMVSFELFMSRRESQRWPVVLLGGNDALAATQKQALRA